MQQIGAHRAELRELNDLNVRTKADLIKWSFVFWVGAVGSIALLAGILK